MNDLKQTHTNFDQTVQQRIQQITLQTESILAQIVQETQQNQQNLLIEAKEQQTVEDEQYRILLEEFIIKLDEKKAKQLALIQEKLKQQRLEIFNESQLKIRTVSEQAALMKNQIMFEEEKKTSENIDLIVNEIKSISSDSAIQQLGTQIKTQINLTLYEKVGSNKSQSEVNFNLDDQNRSNNTNENIFKKITFMSNQSSNQTTLQYPTSIKLCDHQTRNNKLIN
ncbi:unnamed protein product [Rotaria socialis]|nr:unnamed protein product [Rotaria socialis]CAF4557895.1 unnamed protein product [Rotaria socialis]